MKPIVLKVKTDENGNAVITAREIEEIIQKAYDQGREDGKREGIFSPNTYPVYYETSKKIDTTPTSKEYTTISCKGDI